MLYVIFAICCFGYLYKLWMLYRLEKWVRYLRDLLEKVSEACQDDIMECRSYKWRMDRFEAIPYNAYQKYPFKSFEEIVGDASFAEKGTRP